MVRGGEGGGRGVGAYGRRLTLELRKITVRGHMCYSKTTMQKKKVKKKRLQ